MLGGKIARLMRFGRCTLIHQASTGLTLNRTADRESELKRVARIDGVTYGVAQATGGRDWPKFVRSLT